jgi:hypothetical protein
MDGLQSYRKGSFELRCTRTRSFKPCEKMAGLKKMLVRTESKRPLEVIVGEDETGWGGEGDYHDNYDDYEDDYDIW